VDGRSDVGYLPVAEVSKARARNHAASARVLSVLVFLVTVACFAPAVRYGFVAWDDNVALTENFGFRGLSPSHLRWMLTTVHGGDWAPLSWLTLALDHAMWGMNPMGLSPDERALARGERRARLLADRRAPAARRRVVEQAEARQLSLAEYGIGQRVAQAAFGLCFYLRKTIVPTNLSPLYAVDVHLDPTAPKYLACRAFVITAAALLFAYRRRFRWAVAAAASYAIVLLPVLGFVQAGVPAMGDRYSYLSCVPWAVLVAAGIHVATGRPGARRWGVAGATVGSLAVLTLLTVRQTGVWKDSVTLWDQALRVDPANTAAT
jgi:hypothetical protein